MYSVAVCLLFLCRKEKKYVGVDFRRPDFREYIGRFVYKQQICQVFVCSESGGRETMGLFFDRSFPDCSDWTGGKRVLGNDQCGNCGFTFGHCLAFVRRNRGACQSETQKEV